ncbi:MAG: TetR/AcrR family transcriptional regulator [Actinomycetota bacterium]|nr:TetR/AcrR family transcriptional regulator [Actinomycetota bacterium]
MPRLTRKEKQAHTRACLMHSAAKVFARRGLQQASIDEVAEHAGYTKGAFYANFKSKEELFLAMLDERFTERIESIERVIASEGSTAQKARRAGDDFVQMLSADREWERLFFEFSAYAARDEDFREELVTRYRAMRSRIAAALEAHSEGIAKEATLPFDQVALLLSVMSNGFALEKLLEGDSVPDELYGTLLMIFFAGLEALTPTSSARGVGEAA